MQSPSALTEPVSLNLAPLILLDPVLIKATMGHVRISHLQNTIHHCAFCSCMSANLFLVIFLTVIMRTSGMGRVLHVNQGMKQYLKVLEH